jgi:hypothetical protein
MSYYTARLSQDTGISGPHTQFEASSLRAAAIAARDWSYGQTGHPWDCLTIVNEDTDEPFRLQSSYHGCGKRSIQVFDGRHQLVADFNT